MAHKNARQLLSEVAEMLDEIAVYVSQRDSFFSSLARLSADYESGAFSYVEFEQRQKALLRGRAKDEWKSYYRACIYALLKKAEFIASQVITLVYDDTSDSRLAVKGKKPAATVPKAVPASQPAQVGSSRLRIPPSGIAPQPERRIEVFNIDNEILRLKQVLAAKHVTERQAGQLAAVEEAIESKTHLFKLGIPKLEEIEREISEAEIAAKAKSRKAQLQPPQPGRHFSFFTAIASALKAIAKAVTHIHLPKRATTTAKPKPQPAGKKPLLPDIPSPLGLAKKIFASRPRQSGSRIAPRKQGILSAFGGLFTLKKPKKGIFVEEIVRMEKQAKTSETAPLLQQKEPAGLAFGWFSVKGLINELTEKFRSKQEPLISDRTAIPVHVKKLKEMRRKLYEEERLSGFDATLLAQEARRVRKILEVEKPEVYQGSSVGLLANLTVRKVSLFLVDTFPEFFGFLYNGLRAANVKVLSNTYVNIMILSVLFVVALSFIILNVLFFALNYPLYQIFLRTVILSIIAGLACATIFYAYPFMKIKERRRNTMTNMPFAINHMAAVATSGVPPASMFELIAASNEYGEIGTEVKKIVDFISIFGYDLLTAIKTVASTTPSQHFKEFLEGMVSTIETGGDLDRYLRQEADQAALTYNLERQRYNETVSTYSDIYTGLLIAAPLFFVAAMALVNLLGGNLGGIGVDVVMAVGAYAAIPLLNIGFLLFLQVSQPEV